MKEGYRSFFNQIITEEFVRKFGAWFIILAGMLVLLPGTGTIPLIDRDEPRFGQATREMMDRGEWVIPYFNGEFRFDKPPLTYWAMRIFYMIGGVHELTSRLHSVLFTIATALLVFFWGRKLYGPMAGFWGGLTLLTCLQFLIHGRSNVADMPMVFCIALGMWAIDELLKDSPGRFVLRSPWFWALYLSQGLGFLAKGPIVQAVPLLALILWRFIFWRQKIQWRSLGLQWGIPVVLIVVASWGIPALIKTQGLFWDVGIGEHVVNRGVAEFNQRSSAFLYYFGSVFISLAPWICFLGFMIIFLRRNWTRENAYLTAWFVALMVIFTPYATRLPHYVMPGFPAFFLLLGAVISQLESVEDSKGGQRTFKIISSLYILVALFLTAAPLIFKMDFFAKPFDLLAMSGGLLLAGLLTLMYLVAGKPRLIHLLLVLVAIGGVISLLGKTMRILSPVVQIQDILDKTAPETKAIAYRFNEPSLVFYGNRQWEMTGDDQRVRDFVEENPEVLVVYQSAEEGVDKYLKQAFFSRIFGLPAAPPFYPTAYERIAWLGDRMPHHRTIIGFNYARSKFVVIQVYLRQ